MGRREDRKEGTGVRRGRKRRRRGRKKEKGGRKDQFCSHPRREAPKREEKEKGSKEERQDKEP